MKNVIKDIATKELVKFTEKKISRKEALKKTGYLAVSAATMMLLLSSPNKAQAASPPPAIPPSGF